jgi:sterol desaturase/sphingolipid hydroxylase (fatty acid hydroxylase superfamily)
MHDRRLFRLVHRVHHRSHDPSPWAAYAFGPIEALGT